MPSSSTLQSRSPQPSSPDAVSLRAPHFIDAEHGSGFLAEAEAALKALIAHADTLCHFLDARR